jgi:hypothetical protein
MANRKKNTSDVVAITAAARGHDLHVEERSTTHIKGRVKKRQLEADGDFYIEIEITEGADDEYVFELVPEEPK